MEEVQKANRRHIGYEQIQKEKKMKLLSLKYKYYTCKVQPTLPAL